jgi:hypothetical protein
VVVGAAKPVQGKRDQAREQSYCDWNSQALAGGRVRVVAVSAPCGEPGGVAPHRHARPRATRHRERRSGGGDRDPAQPRSRDGPERGPCGRPQAREPRAGDHKRIASIAKVFSGAVTLRLRAGRSAGPGWLDWGAAPEHAAGLVGGHRAPDAQPHQRASRLHQVQGVRKAGAAQSARDMRSLTLTIRPSRPLEWRPASRLVPCGRPSGGGVVAAIRLIVGALRFAPAALAKGAGTGHELRAVTRTFMETPLPLTLLAAAGPVASVGPIAVVPPGPKTRRGARAVLLPERSRCERRPSSCDRRTRRPRRRP